MLKPLIHRLRSYDTLFLAVVALTYLGVVLYGLSIHEVWRDEMRALSMVKYSATLGDLVRTIRNDGHPILWYLLLDWGYHLFPSPLILPILNVAFAFTAVLLFLRFAPFSKLEKLLFVFGMVPLYEYAVIARDYALGMLCLMAILAGYPKRFEKPLGIGLGLALLANSSAVGWLVACALLCSFVVDFFFQWRTGRAHWRGSLAWAALFASAGMAIAAWQCYPDQTAVATALHHHTVSEIWQALGAAIVAYGSGAQAFVTERFPFPIRLFLLLLTLSLWRSPALLIFLVLSVLSFEVFDRTVYHLHLRHWGFLYLALLALFWMRAPQSDLRWQRKAFQVVWLFILLLQVDRGFAALKVERKTQFSVSKKMGAWLSGHPEFREAIIVSEPDFLVESLRYYADNRFYMPRERLFKDFATFTTVNQQSFDLAALSQAARELKAAYHVPILLLYGYRELKPGEYVYGFGGTWKVTADALTEFERCAVLLRDMRLYNERESYAVYRWDCE